MTRRHLRFVVPALAIVAIASYRARITIADAVVRPLLRTDTVGDAEAIVAVGRTAKLSCALDAGSVASAKLAAELFRQGQAPLVIFTGGRRARQSCTAAAAMADLARREGVPA